MDTRRTSEPANGLLKPTFAWAATLPIDIQPRTLLYKFPRIANLIAAMWQDPNSLRRYVDDLLVDSRGNRQGFPLEVLRELFKLRALRRIAPRRFPGTRGQGVETPDGSAADSAARDLAKAPRCRAAWRSERGSRCVGAHPPDPGPRERVRRSVIRYHRVHD